ncbi:Spindle and kinetochore-associated protein 1 [Gracilariopsis chorda]|uniref:Spindle and kinetochore-associated protein 1 n=1 Tax=Gracilariopsis chorda TaxID=448386 RepID=A0A2V3IMT7_9FLOR|nr:Spindle and kinetochore-associated protein 1 [Gracilariopsis chorda]|eukprot:PXF43359.1 Spindle and kinetochore-associated protein 1 [Gracilariopsis chorda]
MTSHPPNTLSPIDEWHSNFNQQVSALRQLLPLRSASQSDMEDEELRAAFNATSSSLADVDHLFASLLQYIEHEETELSQLSKLLERLQRVSTQMRYIEKQMPAELRDSISAQTPKNTATTPKLKQSSSGKTPKHSPVNKTTPEVSRTGRRTKQPTGKSLSKPNTKTSQAKHKEDTRNRKVCDTPQIRHVSQEELDEAPQYVKGRLNVEKISVVVDKLNEVLDKKYALLNKPFRELSSQEMTKYEDLRDAFCPEVKGKDFITDNEIKGFGGCRMDATVKSVINILRHVGAMKEVRGKNRSRIFIIN